MSLSQEIGLLRYDISCVMESFEKECDFNPLAKGIPDWYARFSAIQEGVQALETALASVNEALNMGDGSYKP